MTTVATFDIQGCYADNFTEQQIRDIEVISRFTAALEADSSLMNKIDNETTVEGIYALCKSIVKISFEDFLRVYNQFMDGVKALIFEDEATGRLTDDALDMATGGNKFCSMVSNAFKHAINWVKTNVDNLITLGGSLGEMAVGCVSFGAGIVGVCSGQYVGTIGIVSGLSTMWDGAHRIAEINWKSV